jgi:hypothetical protein
MSEYGNLSNVDNLPPQNVAVVNHYSATLAAANVIVETANPARRRLIISNLGTTVMNVSFGSVASAARGFAVAAGATWDSGGGGNCPGDSLNVFGAATAIYDIHVY